MLTRLVHGPKGPKRIEIDEASPEGQAILAEWAADDAARAAAADPTARAQRAIDGLGPPFQAFLRLYAEREGLTLADLRAALIAKFSGS